MSADPELTQAPLERFRDDKEGATAIEYSMIAAGISIAVAGAIRAVGADVSILYNTIVAAFG
jgi:Flp pilus assembly pilin Flp